MSLALLALGVGSIQQVMSHAPAFNPNLTITTLTGNTRVADTFWMYDEGSYLFQVGHGYLYADLVSFAGIEAQNEVATLDVARTRTELARDLLYNGLQLDPGNAHAWQAYAQAETTLGDFSVAQQALQTSWDIAPHNWQIALKRLYTIQTLRILTQQDDLFADIVDSDKAVLSAHAPKALETLPL